MYRVYFRSSFVRQIKKLKKPLFDKVTERIELLKNKENHQLLKVHKLHGELANYHSFSIGYDLRIIFRFMSSREILLIEIGTHDIYK